MRLYIYWVMLILISPLTGFGANELIISQYIETGAGTSPKGIELWNVSGNTIDFSATTLVVLKGTNGAPLSPDFTLNTGTLAPNAVIVIGTADLQTITESNGATFYLKGFTFNGDDALQIQVGGEIKDTFGQPGIDPGTAWQGSGVSTADQNIGLRSGITTGDIDGWSDPSIRYETITTDDTMTGFGLAPAGASTPTRLEFTTASATVNEASGSYNLTISITNPDSSNATTVEVALTTGDAADIDNYTTQTVTFPANSSTNETLTIIITDDALPEADETLTFTLQNPAGGNAAEVGSQATFDLTITDNDLPNLIINEILADPDATLGDANGDGIVDTADDEFVEIFNDENTAIDLSGWTLSDALSIRHTFPANTIINAGQGIVVFGGGSPTGSFGGSIVQTASSGGLSLNNSGDTITLKDDADSLVMQVIYGSEGGDNQSLTRSPDITGDFVKHSTASGSAGALFSPGTKLDGTPLPVELDRFYGEMHKNGVLLWWTTAAEINNLGFRVYRRSDEHHPYELISGTDVIPGAGTSTMPHEYSFLDTNVAVGKTYFYRLADIEAYTLRETFHAPLMVTYNGGDEPPQSENAPKAHILHQNYPNPFNPQTTIDYTINSSDVPVRLHIYDLEGQRIKTFDIGIQDEGLHSVVWDGMTSEGLPVPSGIYLYELEVNETPVGPKMMTLIK